MGRLRMRGMIRIYFDNLGWGPGLTYAISKVDILTSQSRGRGIVSLFAMAASICGAYQNQGWVLASGSLLN